MSFIPTAMAAASTGAAGAGQQNNPMSLILLLVVFLVIFYFLLWRPQRKKAKEQSNLVSSLQVGDEVITAGGFMGKISKVQDNTIVLKIANETEVTMQKASVSSVLPKGTIKNI
jgi:preprotein translocase subunit YajC